MNLQVFDATASQEATIRSILEGDQLTWDRRRLATLVRVHMRDEVDVPGDAVDNAAYVTYDPNLDVANMYLERRLEQDQIFFRRTITHEFGHIVIEHLSAADQQWICEIAFGKPFSEWETGAWQDRPEEATAEAFVDAFLVNPAVDRNQSRLRVSRDHWSEFASRLQGFGGGEATPPKRVLIDKWEYSHAEPLHSFKDYPNNPTFYRTGRMLVMPLPVYSRARTSDYIQADFILKEYLPGNESTTNSFPEDINLDSAIVLGAYTDGVVPGPGTPMLWTTTTVIDQFGNERTVEDTNIFINRFQQISPDRLVEIPGWFQESLDSPYGLRADDMAGSKIENNTQPGTIRDRLYDPRPGFGSSHIMFGMIATGGNSGVGAWVDRAKFDVELSVEYVGTGGFDATIVTVEYPYGVPGQITAGRGPIGVVPRRRRGGGRRAVAS